MCVPGPIAAQGPQREFTRHTIASALLNLGRAQEAEQAFREILPLVEKVNEPEHSDTLTTRHEHARALLNMRRTFETEQAFYELLRLRRKVDRPEHSYTQINCWVLARCLLENGEPNKAAAILNVLPEADTDPSFVATSGVAILRGWLADLQGDAQRADSLLKEAEIHLVNFPDEHYMR